MRYFESLRFQLRFLPDIVHRFSSDFGCDFTTSLRFDHGVLQGAAQGGTSLLHVCGSPDPLIVQQNERFLP